MRICILNAIVQFGIKTAFSNNQRKRNRLKDVRRFVGAIRYVGAVDGIACTVFVFMFFSLTLLNFSRLIFIFSSYFFFIFVSVFIPIDSLVVSFHPPPTIPFISHFFFHSLFVSLWLSFVLIVSVSRSSFRLIRSAGPAVLAVHLTD